MWGIHSAQFLLCVCVYVCVDFKILLVSFLILIKFIFFCSPHTVQQQLEAIREARRNKVLPSSSQSSSTCSSSSYKCEKRVDLQKKQQSDGCKDAAVKEFLIDDPLHFSVLELSAKNQQLLHKQQLQQLQQQLAGGTQQQQQQQQVGIAAGVDGSGGGAADGSVSVGVGSATLPFTITLDEQKRKVDAGYVSLKDTYTACSSVYGVGTSTSSSSGAANNEACKSSGNAGTEIFPGNDLRPAKIGRMMTAAAAAVVASQGGKSATVSWTDGGKGGRQHTFEE